MGRWWVLGLLACGPQPIDDKDPVDTVEDSDPVDTIETDTVDSDPEPEVTPEDSDPPMVDLPWTDDPCASISVGMSLYRDYVDRMSQRDDAEPPPAGSLVVTGSSSIRRWETAFSGLAAYGVVQRGFGGSRITEVAEFADELILRHQPAGVLLFAGTNDLAFLRPVEEVVDGWRCIVQQVFDAQGPTPVVFIGITPTPSRWLGWPRAEEANQAIADLASQHPQLHVVDIATPFLATGSPPAANLFVADRLHLSEEGYAMWWDAVLPVAEAAFDARAPAVGGLGSGALVRFDLGPGRAADVVEVDGFGIHWNHWHDDGETTWLAGEARRGLVTTTGVSTDVALVVTGGLELSGGGLATPPAGLGTMAVPEATVDHAKTTDADAPGALSLTGLDPALTYTLRLFASLDGAGSTIYRVHGRDPQVEQTLVVGGNAETVIVFSGLRPDAWGQLHIDIRAGDRDTGVLSLLEIEGE